MKFKIINYLILIYLILFLSINNCQSRIPSYLEECYEKEFIQGPQLPMNLMVLIDIIRKAEKSCETTMDLRLFSSSLLHRFKFDGIEKHSGIKYDNGILPFSGTGYQRMKNSIIHDLVPGNYKNFPDKNLTIYERCALHRAISNTILDTENPENDKFCMERPTEKISETLMSKNMIKCPLEQGVILTPYGTLSPGAIISAIAAALQPQKVAVKLLLDIPNEFALNQDDVDIIFPDNKMIGDKSMWLKSILSSSLEIDNTWAATIAGDLAEMAIYQGPLHSTKMMLGGTGFWNNTMRPQVFYLLGKDGTFDATRSELIGDIDGFIIAKNLQYWKTQYSNLRLSQILDLYYSTKGSVFHSDVRACTRGRAFWFVALRTVLEEQVFAFAQVLAYRRSIAHMTNQVLKNLVTQVVDKFTDYTNNHLFPELFCINEKNHPRVEVLVAFDGAWSVEYTSDFIAVLLEDLDVSVFGSKIGLINGENGKWLLNVTDSSAIVHTAFYNLSSNSWPSKTNLSAIFNQVDNYFTDKWIKTNQQLNSFGNLGQVIIILSPTIKMTTQEKQLAVSTMSNLRKNHPDINIMYYTTEENSKNLDGLLLDEKDYLIFTSRIDEIVRFLLTIPRSIRPGKCSQYPYHETVNQMEEYVQPYEKIIYRLDQMWKINTKEIAINFSVVGYGTIEVCTWNQKRYDGRQEKLYCREVSGHSETTFIETFECHDEINCTAIHYQVRGMSSTKKCTEIECRTPEHIRYLMRLENYLCSGMSNISPTFFMFVILIFFIINNSK